LLGLVLALMAVRLVQVQGVQAHSYAMVAENERLRTVDIGAQRGTITDRNGQVLARSVEARTVTADPELVSDPAMYAHLLSPLLGVDETTLTQRLGDRPHRYVVLARDIDPMVWRKVATTVDPGTGKPIQGVFAEVSTKRVYPADDIAANVLGFLDSAGAGMGGIERQFDQLLAGTPGKLSYERDRRGNRIATAGDRQVAPQAGDDLQLTIDRDIEWTAQQAIAAKVKETKAVSGTVVVTDIPTGEILAMATAPTFDPNDPGKGADVNRGNRALSQVYEPGSIAKVMTMAALIEQGVADPGTRLNVPGELHRAGKVLHDDVAHGIERLTLAGVLAQSSNVGTVLATDRINSDTLYRYLKAFGIGSPTGLAFPGESRGILAPPNKWSGTQRYTIPFGQGFAVNSVQMADVYATLGNGGVRVAPQLIKSWIDPSGRRHVPTPGPSSRVVSARTATDVIQMMEQVVAKGGTAPDVKVAGYALAGKTGTAQFADPTCRCYRGYTASFAGLAPADAPQIAISVTLQQPEHGHFGGALGGPVFVRTMAFALQALGIRPTGIAPARIPITW
jgi:cell division protein FtsI (penicillin-binding protein 3)